MENYYSTQVERLVSKGKNGTTVVGFEHTFPKFYSDDYFEQGKSLEPTGLNRFVVNINQKKADGTVSVKANLPAAHINRVFKISEALMLDDAKGVQNTDVPIYLSPAKYMRGFDDSKGNPLCYQLKISYNSQMRAKIKIEVKNFHAPVNKMPDGTTQIMGTQITNEKTVSIFVTTNDWYDCVSHLKDLWDSYQTSAFEANLKKSFIPKKSN